MNLKIAEKRYLQQRAQARMRKIPFTITFEQWIGVWIDSGKWEQRGRRKDQYCMSRIADKGGYELDNIFIQLQGENVKDAQIGRLRTDAEIEKLIKSHIGKKQLTETKNKISIATKGRVPWNKGKTSMNQEKQLNSILTN